jgi:hypothetical protein
MAHSKPLRPTTPDQFMYLAQHLQQWSQTLKREHVRPIRRSDFRVVVHFHENSIHSTSDSGTRERFDVFR